MVKRLTAAATFFGLAALTAIGGCQENLPPLERGIYSPTPPKEDVVAHLRCELATIVNATTPAGGFDRSANPELTKRVDLDPALQGLLPNLVKYHFVATAQLTLEVTDAQGLTPALTFITPYSTPATTGSFNIGAQLTGTQDRSININYAIDLSTLVDVAYKTKLCNGRDIFNNRTSAKNDGGGINGNLGLADIVADGLIGIQETSVNNVYSTSGPTQPTTEQPVALGGSLNIPAGGAAPAQTFQISPLNGTIVFAPPQAGTPTQGAVSLTGVATISSASGPAKYVVNLTGAMLPPDSVGDNPKPGKPDLKIYFLLSGNMTAINGAQTSVTNALGVNPSVSLSGTVDRKYTVASLSLGGLLTPTAPAPTGTASIPISLAQPPVHGPAGPAGASASKTGAGASASGTTSFGTLVDFTLVYGANAGPSWTLVHFKGPGGGTGSGGQLFNASRTNTNSLSITFVASCQAFADIPPTISSYWDTVGPCDSFGLAQQQSEYFGYQNNSVMWLKNLLLRPAPTIQP